MNVTPTHISCTCTNHFRLDPRVVMFYKGLFDPPEEALPRDLPSKQRIMCLLKHFSAAAKTLDVVEACMVIRAASSHGDCSECLG